MKNDKNRRKTATAFIALFLAMIMLAGCGKGKDDKEEESSKKEFVYVPEYHQIDFGISSENMNISQTVASGDYMYMQVNAWNEESGSENGIFRYNMVEGTLDEIPLELGENDWPGQICVTPEGDVAVIISRTSYELDENGEPINYSSSLELRVISSKDGSVKNSQDITGIFGEEDPYIQYLSMDGKGNYYLYGGDQTIFVISQELQKIAEIKTGDWINGMVASKEGDIYVNIYGEKGPELRKVDLASKSIGESLEGLGGGYGNAEYYTGVSKSIMFSGEKVALYDIASKTQEDIFSWLDVDVNSNYIRGAGELSDGRIWAAYQDYETENSKPELLTVKKEKADNVTPKEEITYGTMALDWDVKRMIIDFNKSNEKYRIVVKEYGTEDYQTGRTQFNADLTTKNCPDLVELSALNYTQYASKGIFEDLYPYMDQSGLKKEDFLENVLKAYEVDGKLYAVVPGFYVTTTMAKQSMVGDITGWTLAEMLDFVEKNDPENIFDGGARESIFYYFIYNNIDEFIDWETGKCFFDGEDFIRTLEFAAKFPSYEEMNMDYSEREGIYSRLKANKILLMQSSISSVQQFQMMMGMFGEKVSFVGYPNNERKGNLIQSTGGCIGLSAKSKNKEGAWEFLSGLWSKEYQESKYSDWGFPVMKSALEKKFKEDMTPEYYEDENGEQIEQSKTSWGYDDFNMEIYAATQEEIDQVRALLESAEKISGNVDEQLTNIITEESAAFFKGQKSAADTANVIQNRIQIYVNENQ